MFILWYGKRPMTVRTWPIDCGNGYSGTECVCLFPDRRSNGNRGRRPRLRAEPKRSAECRRLSHAHRTADDYCRILFELWATARNSIFSKIRQNSLALFGTERKMKLQPRQQHSWSSSPVESNSNIFPSLFLTACLSTSLHNFPVSLLFRSSSTLVSLLSSLDYLVIVHSRPNRFNLFSLVCA